MKRIMMLVLMMVTMVIMSSPVSAQADSLNLTIREFIGRGVVYTEDSLPAFTTGLATSPSVVFVENGKNTTISTSGIKRNNVSHILPYTTYSEDISNLYYTTLTRIRVNNTHCYFNYYGDKFLDGVAIREVRDVIVTLYFHMGYSNDGTSPGNQKLPVMSLALRLEDKNIGVVDYPIYIEPGETLARFRVVVHNNGEYSVTRVK